MLSAIAGYDPRDPTTSVLPVPDYAAALTGDVKGFRWACSAPSSWRPPGWRSPGGGGGAEGAGGAGRERAGSEPRHREVAARCLLRGDRVRGLRVPRSLAQGASAEYGDDVRERLRVGAFVSGSDYLKGQRARARIRDEVNAALGSADVLVCATTPLVATAVGQSEIAVGRTRCRCGEPDPVHAAVQPARASRGLHPVRFHGGGAAGGAADRGSAVRRGHRLRVADAYQRATDWHRRRPHRPARRCRVTPGPPEPPPGPPPVPTPSLPAPPPNEPPPVQIPIEDALDLHAVRAARRTLGRGRLPPGGGAARVPRGAAHSRAGIGVSARRCARCCRGVRWWRRSGRAGRARRLGRHRGDPPGSPG